MPGVTQPEIILVIDDPDDPRDDPRCETCKKSPARYQAMILLEMKPGPDGKPWYLCVPCWFEGLHPNSPRGLGSTDASQPAPEPAPEPVRSPRRARAKATSQGS